MVFLLMLIFCALFVWPLMGVVGAAIGSSKNLGCAGFVLGFVLGPIGWVIIAVMHGNQPPAQPVFYYPTPYSQGPPTPYVPPPTPPPLPPALPPPHSPSGNTGWRWVKILGIATLVAGLALATFVTRQREPQPAAAATPGPTLTPTTEIPDDSATPRPAPLVAATPARVNPIPVSAPAATPVPATPAPATTPTFEESVKSSLSRAMAKYPELAVPNSTLNSVYLEAYRSLHEANDPLLNQPNWPEVLATQCAQNLSPRPTPPPTIWRTPHPPYPAQARMSHLQGETMVRITTDASGNVSSVTIVKSAGSAILDGSTQSYVRQNWKGPPNATKDVTFAYALH